jgi:HAD superfamily hydrolase (TIGR01490 family)
MSRVAFFDLDRTLIDVNSGGLWLRHEWDEGNVGVRDVAWATWWLLKYSFGSGSGMDDAYKEAVRTLKGKAEADIDRRTRAWFETQVRPHLRPGAKDALARHRDQGDRLVLATTSSPYAARAATEAYGLDAFVCTWFEVKEGVFTGDVASPAWGPEKAARVAEWAEREGVDLATSAFYTDSMTDLALLERVGEPVCVNPDRRLARLAASRGWPIVDGTSRSR